MKLRVKSRFAGKVIVAGMVCVLMMAGSSSSVFAIQETSEVESEMLEGTFRPSDTVFTSEDKFDYPFLGLRAVLPEKLLEKMDSKEVAMLSEERWTAEFDEIEYALLSWSTMTEEQRDAEVEKLGDGYTEWTKSLGRIGTLGVFREDQVANLDEITGCTQHEELGTSEDGAYAYYLSVNPEADEALTSEVRQIQTELSEMVPLQDVSVFGQPSENADVETIAPFSTEQVSGEACTEEVFQDKELTMVNVFATWCSPCIKEIPDLEKLYEEMAEQGVGVVGVVLDAVGDDREEAVEKAKILAEKVGVTYPLLLPDSTNLNGRLDGISAVPETFFVDQDGNIVGETYSGSRSFDDWKVIVEAELANLKGDEE